MLSFKTNRELLRLANREHFNSTEVAALLEFGEYMQAIRGESEPPDAAHVLFNMWKESWDEEP